MGSKQVAQKEVNYFLASGHLAGLHPLLTSFNMVSMMSFSSIVMLDISSLINKPIGKH